jgi:dehydrogenase/reductase SDR family protein 12
MLERSAPARIINVSSGGMYGQGLPGEDVESDHAGYGPKKLYARTKREQVVITEQGADTIVWLGGADEPLHSTGLFWHDRRSRPTRYLLGPGEEPPEDRRRLWEACESALAAG